MKKSVITVAAVFAFSYSFVQAEEGGSDAPKTKIEQKCESEAKELAKDPSERYDFIKSCIEAKKQAQSGG